MRLFTIVFCAFFFGGSALAEKPKIIFILADDLGVIPAIDDAPGVIRDQQFKLWVNQDSKSNKLLDLENEPGVKQHLFASDDLENAQAQKKLQTSESQFPKVDRRPRYDPTPQQSRARTCKPEQLSASIISVEKIWDAAPHNAFTDLVRFKDHWYCVFREGKSHVSPDGALRVIRSRNGDDWVSSAHIRSPDSDLRDAKITVTPKGQLMLSGAEAMHVSTDYHHQSLVWFSENGTDWTDALEVGDRDNWLWRTTWHRNIAYGFGYGTRPDNRSLTLYSSRDGRTFQPLVKEFLNQGYANETSLVFLDNEHVRCLLRRDGKPSSALLGLSKPPYRKWQWRDLGVKIGGPKMIHVPGFGLVAVVRLYDGGARTSICTIDSKTAKLREILKLPSSGDTSYAGMAWHDNVLWISYYSSHEEKTNIYLAKVKMKKK